MWVYVLAKRTANTTEHTLTGSTAEDLLEFVGSWEELIFPESSKIFNEKA
ncbi:MAG: hypothetical protein V7L21_32600 [Nostoc sp.]